MTREQAFEQARVQIEWLVDHPEEWGPELRVELRGKTPTQIASALLVSCEHLADEIMKEHDRRI